MSCTGRYAKIETDGYSIHRAALTTDAIDELGAGLDHLVAGDAKYGIRNLLAKAPEIRDLANAPRIKALVDPVLGPNAFPVRAIFFDKVPAANWGVPWHQDLTIAVKKRIDIDGYGAWSVKAGVPHVQPPAEVLRGMLTLRIHLDDANESNGALIVVPGSHLMGRLASEQIARLVEHSQSRLCEVQAGDVLAMRPLLVHASRTGPAPARRRVIHVEYASCALPPGLTWFEAAPGGA